MNVTVINYYRNVFISISIAYLHVKKKSDLYHVGPFKRITMGFISKFKIAQRAMLRAMLGVSLRSNQK